MFFTPDADGVLSMSLEAVGVNNNETLTIVAAPNATVANGSVSFPVKAGKRSRVDITLSEEYDGPVEIRARLAQPQGAVHENK